MTQILAITLHTFGTIMDFLFAPNPVHQATRIGATETEMLRVSVRPGLL
ncbi:MAG TPA: hypothetical protein VGK74_07910 [Symbiobacteriaceae bacterium]|jgi:hypothetical protein